MSIINIQERMASLDDDERELVTRFFDIDLATGVLDVPDGMEDWVADTFGSVEAVTSQDVVKITNSFTKESSLFNALRADRPMVVEDSDVRAVIEESAGGPFCSPREMTPEDSFGRIEGEHCVTASNIAKYDAWHGLVVFDDHDPLGFKESHVIDYVKTAGAWFDKVNEVDAKASYPFLVWHCLWKSAASIVHGHMQLLMTNDRHYGHAEQLNHVRQEYVADYGTDYFEDLYRAHASLGLAFEDEGVKRVASLTPKKEKEIMLVADACDGAFASALYDAVATLRDDFGVESFTVGVILPPMHDEQGWEGFPVVGRVIDRGSLAKKTADVGSMELFAGSSVVASDPYKLIEALR
jgi:hypothetical protein